MRRPLLSVFAAAAALVWAAPGQACELEGVLEGFVELGVVDGIEFVAPVFRDALVRGCELPVSEIVPVMADPEGGLWIAGTPRLRVGEAARVALTPARGLGTHVVEHELARRGEVGTLTVPAGVGAVRKSGNGQPPCSRDQWREEAFPLRVLVQEDGSDDVTDGSDIEAVTMAAEAWAGPSCSDAVLEVTPTPDRTLLVPDGRITVEWIEEPTAIFANLGAENLGFTCYVCDDEGYFVEADVRFDGAGHTWSTTCDGTAWDILGAAMHELGHVLGVPHLEDPDAVMFPVTSARRLLSTRVLARADAMDACERYPCEDGDCSAPVAEALGCPAGAGTCAPCSGDEACGAEGDRCVSSVSSDLQVCARACSPSFPCPDGYLCASVGGPPKQCVPEDVVCPDQGFVGCPCETDEECGGEGDRCLSDGVCGASCDGGVACPDGTLCQLLYDDDGLPMDRQCVPGDAFEPRCDDGERRRGCRCGAAPSGRSSVVFAFVLVALMRSPVRKRAR